MLGSKPLQASNTKKCPKTEPPQTQWLSLSLHYRQQVHRQPRHHGQVVTDLFTADPEPLGDFAVRAINHQGLLVEPGQPCSVRCTARARRSFTHPQPMASAAHGQTKLRVRLLVRDLS